MRLMAFPRRRKWLAPDFGKKVVGYLGRASPLWQISLRFSEVGSAGGKGMMGSPREFALAFSEIKKADQWLRRYINQLRMQNKSPPMLELGRVKIRAVIQNPVRLPLRIMIALLSSSNLDIKRLRRRPALYYCVEGWLWAEK